MRIFVLEDEVLIAVHLEMELQDRGFEIVGPAHTLNTAHDLIRQNEIDFAVLDANINGESPATVASALREKGIGFVYVTGYDSQFVERELPPAKVLSKPVDTNDLVSHFTMNGTGEDTNPDQ